MTTLLALVVQLAFFGSPAFSAPSPTPAAASTAEINPDPSLVDPKVEPCDDFYQYACGGWIAKAVIPGDRPYWDRGFAAVDERNKLLLRSLLEGYAAGKSDPPNPYAKQLGDLYASCMDENAIKTGSVRTLQSELQAIDAMRSKDELPKQVSWMQLRGMSALFDVDSTQDFKNPEEVIAEVSQGGMGLPTRDYYIDKTPRAKALRKKYEDYIARLLEKTGEKKAVARKDAAIVLRLETEMAQAALSPVELRDPVKVYHRMDRAQFAQIAPDFDWGRYFASLGLPDVKSLNVATPDFMKAASQVIRRAPLAELKAYLRFHLIHGSLKGLPDSYYQEYFNFFGKTIFGLKEIPARWKRCIDASNELMGFAVGRSFVGLTFVGDSKKLSREMIEEVEKAEHGQLEQLPWMDKKTREAALEKLGKLVNQVGYPDKWRDYDKLKITRDSYLSNRYEGKAFNNEYDLSKVGKPLDRTDWLMPPSMVNAYYDSQMNKMVFPAGILQPPFFSADYPIYSNYGGIGMVMGHELSHGFDDEGRQFNASGAMADWWSKEAAADFGKRAECLARQYDQYPAAGATHVNGHLTLGEDIGDQGGAKLSYLAWKSTLPNEISRVESALRAEERKFFLAMAQAWCSKETEAFEEFRVKTNPHPPNRYRVNGSLVNLPAFADAYQCKTGSKMAPENRCIVW